MTAQDRDRVLKIVDEEKDLFVRLVERNQTSALAQTIVAVIRARIAKLPVDE